MGRILADAIITLSIEPIGKPAYQHGFHLGTIEVVARQLAEEQFYRLRDTRTVALIRNRRIMDVFDGTWLSDSEAYTPSDSAALGEREVDMKTRLTGRNRSFNKSALHTLGYFRRGYERDPAMFWLADDHTPFRRLVALKADGLLEQPEHPLDLWRITPAGLALLDAEG